MYDMIAEKHGIDNINQVEADGDLQKSTGRVLMVFRSFQIRETPLAGSEIQRVSLEGERGVPVHDTAHKHPCVSSTGTLIADPQPIETSLPDRLRFVSVGK